MDLAAQGGLVSERSSGPPLGLAVWWNNGDGSFAPPQFFDSSSHRTLTLAVGDFNNDGAPDLLTGNSSQNTVTIILNGRVPSGVLVHNAPLSASGVEIHPAAGVAFTTVVADGTGEVTTEVVLHVRGDGCHADDGTPIPDTVIAELVPDAFVRVLIHDAEGHPINASGRQRHPSARQKRVVKERDQVCVDCGRPDLLEYDHVPPFDKTGRTLVDELELRCAPCHQRRHRHRAA